ncbi:hypothetical protein TREMEDRAFT_64787 [Tremella mesenterica DSM 1558]|uniref:uncharacterized protein n=1 Tax=Tremella mesenterica (strain ATCC 24925 / CBS 8224 / DSM 1558 / NBRC 9311 / NRRL Y-6157 / RJB 2259-6 / UBC 559-6) TaxID=578456 RepID=UPI0003F4A055|nr:uncharacterized protein TREMEDRAFT_64787 [Tremella mesenterica DSM 1558]EIW66932.1 hypothetical protein TREMEDRAFT_64787 [Tremella mesenterica DSM 1558]
MRLTTPLLLSLVSLLEASARPEPVPQPLPQPPPPQLRYLQPRPPYQPPSIPKSNQKPKVNSQPIIIQDTFLDDDEESISSIQSEGYQEEIIVKTPEEIEEEEQAAWLALREKDRANRGRTGPVGLAEEFAGYARAKKGPRRRRRKNVNKVKKENLKIREFDESGKSELGSLARGFKDEYEKKMGMRKEKVLSGDEDKWRDYAQAETVAAAHSMGKAKKVEDDTERNNKMGKDTESKNGEGNEGEGMEGYSRCLTQGRIVGYARYPGWVLEGDELSGSVPVTPEMSCMSACTHYGEACTGVSFSPSKKSCRLKGITILSWDLRPSTATGDVVDLAGGCEAWAPFVPPEMNAVCCDA